ncbi:exosporium leader peptide-containing protein [Bacillus thuringiensis]|uniref:exosporium leader peptide-containing protein n=1 Tax=Bacillus thuringiensis TaxID=1428 RepID=UPI0036E3E0C8
MLDECLNAAVLNPNLIGPTLPSIPPFTLPTGVTGPNLSGTFIEVVQNGSNQTVTPADPFIFNSQPIASNITFNGSDTLTIIDSGTYTIGFYVGISITNTTTPIIISVSINGTTTGQRTMELDTTAGEISTTLIRNLVAGDNIQLINNSTGPLITSPSNGFQSLRLIIYRIF